MFDEPLTNINFRHSFDPRVQQCVSDSINAANSFIGVQEIRHSNNSPQIAKFKGGRVNDYPWCAYFTNYICTHGLQDSSLFNLESRIGSSQEIKKAADKEGLLRTDKSYTPNEGDLIIWQDKRKPAQGHIGIVTKVYPDGSFDTVQGNVHDQVEEIHYNSRDEAQHPTPNEYSSCNLVGFVDMHSYYQIQFTI